jgi:LAO/AO transport system kinase
VRGDGQREPAPSVEVESARLGYQFNTIGVIPRQSKTGASLQTRKSDRVPPQRTDTRRPDVMTLSHGVRAGNRTVLARAITLVESKRADHQAAARRLVQDLLPATGRAIRVGITGVPGVGKSTTIDALGIYLTGQGHKVAVLAVDPSSNRTGGSILADKTRMPRLAADPAAFIRPSPTSGSLGGVAAKTRETLLICEAAGFDVILVETVGVGQSETAVADLTDFFLLLMLPGAGDEIQGIKKGVIELADMIAINKADGDNIKRATTAAAEYRAALHILVPRSPNWSPEVITYSALNGQGIADLWARILAHRAALTATGELEGWRRQQQVKWMWSMLEERVFAQLKTHPVLKARVPAIEDEVAQGRLSPALAVDEIAIALGL